MTYRDVMLEELSKLDNDTLFYRFCRTQSCGRCRFFAMFCRDHEKWMDEEVDEEETQS